MALIGGGTAVSVDRMGPFPPVSPPRGGRRGSLRGPLVGALIELRGDVSCC